MLISGRVLTGASALVGVAGLALVAAAAIWSDTLLQLASPGLAALALLVSAAALRQSARSADAASRSAAIAEDQEQRRKYGWVIRPRQDDGEYELRNIGSVNARCVRLSGDFFKVEFIHEHGGERELVHIDAGESKVFYALKSFSQAGREVDIVWQPEGEPERRWREVIPPGPRDLGDRKDLRYEERARADECRRVEARELQQRILQLGDAYSRWKADPSDPAKKLRVQLLVAALPPDLAREIGYQVDVARDVWGPEEYPLVRLVPAEDRHLVENELAEIELIWNMRQVTGYEVYGPTESVSLNAEPRIWWAVRGYAERQKERQSGDRKLRRSPADQKRHDEATAQLEQLSTRFSAERDDTDPVG